LWQYQIILAIAIISPEFSLEPGKLRVLNTVAALQIYSPLVHQPKVSRTGAVFASKILEGKRIKHYRTEHEHLDVESPGLHCVAVAAKDRHAESAMIIERKPVAISPLHGIQITHRANTSRVRTGVSLSRSGRRTVDLCFD
jgi:hypothetical protein